MSEHRDIVRRLQRALAGMRSGPWTPGVTRPWIVDYNEWSVARDEEHLLIRKQFGWDA